MARTNYGYEKRQRELAKKKKAEQKRLRRLAKRQEKNADGEEVLEGDELDGELVEDGDNDDEDDE